MLPMSAGESPIGRKIPSRKDRSHREISHRTASYFFILGGAARPVLLTIGIYVAILTDGPRSGGPALDGRRGAGTRAGLEWRHLESAVDRAKCAPAGLRRGQQPRRQRRDGKSRLFDAGCWFALSRWIAGDRCQPRRGPRR